MGQDLIVLDRFDGMGWVKSPRDVQLEWRDVRSLLKRGLMESHDWRGGMHLRISPAGTALLASQRGLPCL